MYSWLVRSLGMPSVRLLTGSQFWTIYQEMRRFDQLADRERFQSQNVRLRSLVDHAYQHVPFHRKRMDQAGLKPEEIRTAEDLSLLPISRREEIQANFPDRVTDQSSPGIRRQYAGTRGTTGERMIVVMDFDKRDAARAGQVRIFEDQKNRYRLGQRQAYIPPNICNQACGIEGESEDDNLWATIKELLWTRGLRDEKARGDLNGIIERQWIMNRMTLPPFPLEGTSVGSDTVDQCIQQLRSYRPRLLKALPTYLRLISERIVQSGQEPLAIPVIKPMGASASLLTANRIMQGFSGIYLEDYGSREFGSMAADPGDGLGLRPFDDLFVLELVRNNRPVAEGELGRVLVTDLSNRAMPLIRYDIGDVGRWSRDSQGNRRLAIEGRIQDTVVTRDGRAFSQDMITDFFLDHPSVHWFELIERSPGVFQLNVVPREEDQLSEVRDQFLEWINEPQAQMKVQPVKAIQPLESGKYRFVRSQSWTRFDESEASHVAAPNALLQSRYSS